MACAFHGNLSFAASLPISEKANDMACCCCPSLPSPECPVFLCLVSLRLVSAACDNFRGPLRRHSGCTVRLLLRPDVDSELTVGVGAGAPSPSHPGDVTGRAPLLPSSTLLVVPVAVVPFALLALRPAPWMSQMPLTPTRTENDGVGVAQPAAPSPTRSSQTWDRTRTEVQHDGALLDAEWEEAAFRPVVHFGNPSLRRKAMLHRLSRRGVAVQFLTNVFGDDLSAALQHASIVVAPALYPGRTFTGSCPCVLRVVYEAGFPPCSLHLHSTYRHWQPRAVTFHRPSFSCFCVLTV
jgi:hypothetical protein